MMCNQLSKFFILSTNLTIQLLINPFPNSSQIIPNSKSRFYCDIKNTRASLSSTESTKSLPLPESKDTEKISPNVSHPCIAVRLWPQAPSRHWSSKINMRAIRKYTFVHRWNIGRIKKPREMSEKQKGEGGCIHARWKFEI